MEQAQKGSNMSTITAPTVLRPRVQPKNGSLPKVGSSSRSSAPTKAEASTLRADRKPFGKRQIVLLLIVLLGIALAFGYWLSQSSFLDVDEVKIVGAVRTDVESILETSGLSRGDPLLGLGLTEARSRIVELPWVKSVRSERSWSGEVTLSISERTPVAAIAVPGAWSTVDEDGRVLELSSEQPRGVAAVEGVWMEQPAPGDWLDLTYLKDPLMAAGAMNEVLQSAVRAVVVSPEGLILDLNIPGYVLLKEGRNIEEKMSTVEAFLTQVDLECLDRLDVRATTAPVLTRTPDCV